MCNVHLIETSRAIRKDDDVAGHDPRCYCGAPVQGKAVFIEGHLDDGSPGRYRFVYYPDCVWSIGHDVKEIDQNKCCFNHGSAIEVVDATAGMEATVTFSEHPGLSCSTAPSTRQS